MNILLFSIGFIFLIYEFFIIFSKINFSQLTVVLLYLFYNHKKKFKLHKLSIYFILFHVLYIVWLCTSCYYSNGIFWIIVIILLLFSDIVKNIFSFENIGKQYAKIQEQILSIIWIFTNCYLMYLIIN